MFGVFDVLHVDGRDLRISPLRERRAVLEKQLDGCPLELFSVERLGDDGMEAWVEVTCRRERMNIGVVSRWLVKIVHHPSSRATPVRLRLALQSLAEPPTDEGRRSGKEADGRTVSVSEPIEEVDSPTAQ